MTTDVKLPLQLEGGGGYLSTDVCNNSHRQPLRVV